MVYPLTILTKAIQSGSNVTPILRVEFENGAKLDTLDPDDGLRSVELVDEYLSSRGTIVASPKSILSWLNPSILDSYKGTKVTIHIGFVGTTQSIHLTPLYIASVYSVSTPGGINITFNLISWWELLAGSRVVRDPGTSDAPPPVWERDTTIRGILNELLSGKAPVFLDDSDGIVPTYKPYYEADGYESVLTTVRNLMDMTRSYIKLRANGFHIVHPDDSDVVTQGYTLADGGYPFQMKSLTSTLVIPNRIVVVPALPTSESAPDFIGVATDLDSISKVDFVDMIVLDEGLLSRGEANVRASVLLSRIQSASSKGVMEASVHIGQELFDKIAIEDDRTGGPSDSQRVGKIRRLWSSGQFIMELGLGGLAPHLGGIQTYPDDFGTLQPTIGPPVGGPGPIGAPFGPSSPTPGPTSPPPPAYAPPGPAPEPPLYGPPAPPSTPPVPIPVPTPPPPPIGTPPPPIATPPNPNRAIWSEAPARAVISPQLDSSAGRSYASVSSTPGVITGRRHRETWYIKGTIATVTAQGMVPKVHGGRWRIIEAGARVKIAPTGSSITIDIEYRLTPGGPWASVFINSFNRLSIAAGATEALGGRIDPGLILPLTTILRMNTSSTASPLGAELTVELDSSIRSAGQ